MLRAEISVLYLPRQAAAEVTRADVLQILKHSVCFSRWRTGARIASLLTILSCGHGCSESCWQGSVLCDAAIWGVDLSPEISARMPSLP
jgi:hypothetical protein